MSRRIAFYPCCADDISEPRQLMAGLADEVIYCDLRIPRSWKQQASYDSTPQIHFLQGDVRDKIDELPVIDDDGFLQGYVDIHDLA